MMLMGLRTNLRLQTVDTIIVRGNGTLHDVLTFPISNLPDILTTVNQIPFPLRLAVSDTLLPKIEMIIAAHHDVITVPLPRDAKFPSALATIMYAYQYSCDGREHPFDLRHFKTRSQGVFPWDPQCFACSHLNLRVVASTDYVWSWLGGNTPTAIPVKHLAFTVMDEVSAWAAAHVLHHYPVTASLSLTWHRIPEHLANTVIVARTQPTAHHRIVTVHAHLLDSQHNLLLSSRAKMVLRNTRDTLAVDQRFIYEPQTYDPLSPIRANS